MAKKTTKPTKHKLRSQMTAKEKEEAYKAMVAKRYEDDPSRAASVPQPRQPKKG